MASVSSTPPATPPWSPNAERYYRAMYYGGDESWNLRDRHMFETLEALLAFHGPDARRSSGSTTPTSATRAPPRWACAASSTSASSAASASRRGVLVGFGTDRGTVAAAHDWDGPMAQ
jgi:protein-L-isoaspartate(D-aspartate) O-methyltransferase